MGVCPYRDEEGYCERWRNEWPLFYQEEGELECDGDDEECGLLD